MSRKFSETPVVMATVVKNDSSSSVVAGQWPSGLVNAVKNTFSNGVNEENAKKYLSSHHWPSGLQDSILKNCAKIPIRFIIIDDSGSMSTADGKRAIIAAGPGSSSKVSKIIDCTRWSELTSALINHAEFADTSSAATEFRLLNGADPVMVGLPGDNGDGLSFLTEVLEESPGGKTPLCASIRSVVQAVEKLASSLRQCNKRAAVIIATDGEATDGNVAEALKPLEQLPVWVVVRLCTNEEKVVQYWDAVDKQLELEMDVLDDLVGDADQVFEYNPWLTYAEPFHRIREFGSTCKELDLIDECRLTSEQMRTVVAYLFVGGNKLKEVPHPEADWPEFMKFIHTHNMREGMVFNTITNKNCHWIDERALVAQYGGAHSSSTCVLM